MSVYPFSLRYVLATLLAAGTVSAGPAYAFADDDARRAILDLREQLHQMVEQDRRIRLEFADQIEMLRNEISSLRGEVERSFECSEITFHIENAVTTWSPRRLNGLSPVF